MIKRYADLVIPVLLLGILSLIFIFTDLDLAFHRNFYSIETGWFLKDIQPWKFIYHYGNIPALLLSIGSLIILALSPYYARIRRYAKPAIYLILVMAIGPGLLVNSILKDNWGRPRPRNITEFGGKYKYEQLLTIDPDSPGKSFPCGHASMGFYFFALYFIFRKRKKLFATATFIFALLWGGMIGLARIVQGGHFLSDVIWSAGLVYLLSFFIYKIMKLDMHPEFVITTPLTPQKQRAFTIISSISIIIAVVVVSLATPYSKEKSYRMPERIDTASVYLVADLQLLSSEIYIREEKDLEINFTANGFGFPRSKIQTKFNTSYTDQKLNLSYRQSLKGFFTELEQNDLITLPKDLQGEISVYSSRGSLNLYIPEGSNWLVIPLDVEKVIDPTGYLTESKNIKELPNGILEIKLNLPQGSVTIYR